MVCHPLPITLLHLREHILHLRHRSLEEVVSRSRRIRGELFLLPLLVDLAEIVGDFDDDTSFLPGFTSGGDLQSWLIQLPASFWQDPGSATGGGDEEDFLFVVGEGNNTGDETLAFCTVT